MLSNDAIRLQSLAERELGVPSALHEYQWHGVAFLYRASAALLADEMGLGKTIQAAVALALLLRASNDIWRALIIAPASLTVNWMREIARWAPSITVRVVTGDARAREAFYLLPIPVLVASYDQIRFDSLDRVPADTFDLVILDEAQRIKNRDSATAFACSLLPRKRSWALTATPLENAPTDVASILSFLEPSLANSRLAKARMATELQARMLRRRKRDVRSELPAVILQDLPLGLPESQRQAYDALWFDRTVALRQSASTEIGTALLGLITRLKILCNCDELSGVSVKLDALRTLCEGAGEDARIIVFPQFVETLQWVSVRLDIPREMLTGSMPIEARYAAISRFAEHEPPRALLVSLRAGGVGLNLGEATHVVLFDRWWNPAVEVQAIYRAHRFARDMPLHVTRFLIEDSIEERRADILTRKERLFDEVVESVDASGRAFTHQEMMEILQVSPEDLGWPPACRKDGEHGEDSRVSSNPIGGPSHRQRPGPDSRAR